MFIIQSIITVTIRFVLALEELYNIMFHHVNFVYLILKTK